MTKQSITYNDFSFGEISRNLFGRGNISVYKSSAMNLVNFDVIQTGGIERRAGLRFVCPLSSAGKIIAFEYSESEMFLLFFRDEYIDIFDKNGSFVKTLYSPYTLSDLAKLRWVQKGQTLYLVHPFIPPRIIKYKRLEETWSIEFWIYPKHPTYGYSCEPFTRIEGTEGITLTPSGVTGEIKLASSKPLFSNLYVGVRILLNGGQLLINSVISTRVVNATVDVELNSTSADANWQEQAFSEKSGYPSSIAFYQNRLVIGGTDVLKNRLWFSKIGEYFNFDLGSGLDDDAIEFDIFSDKRNQIVSVFSGKHLQVFTSDSEWMVTGNPITPSNINVSQQTKIGSVDDRYIAPKFVEGSTFFVARNKKEIREFFYGDLSENYSSEDLILLSSHLLNNPIEQDYNVKRRMLYVVQEDGTLAVLLTNKSHNTNAWVQYKTDGKFKSLAVLLDKVYVVVERDGVYSLEIFDDEFCLDKAKKITSSNAISVVSNLDFLNNKDVTVVGDGEIYNLHVENNEINLPKPCKNIVVGIPFTHIFCPLPVFVGSSYIPKAVRLLELNLRLMDTESLEVDSGAGLKNIYLGDNETFSGDVKIRGKGFIKNYQLPLFKIQSSKPCKLKILNMSMLIDVIR
ncbi:MAG: hypothetical protein IJ638_04180 [Alphaproteobacteria bacterium]|nr:hypothetical protein [Alphaproteobacteria bacterium]